MSPATDELADFLVGFVVAEGCFTQSGTPPTFDFTVGLGAIDRTMCEELRRFFGVGHIVDSPRRKEHYDDESAYHVRSLRDLVEVVVPFMDEWLPPSYKRLQYLAWRGRLLDYWGHGAKRRRSCTVEGCEELQRGKGLCRRHYYAAYGI